MLLCDIINKMDNNKLIQSLRQHLVTLYFKIMESMDSDGDRTMIDESDDDNYTHHCEVCNKMTTYNEKPPADYPLPLCLTDECLEILINKQ